MRKIEAKRGILNKMTLKKKFRSLTSLIEKKIKHHSKENRSENRIERPVSMKSYLLSTQGAWFWIVIIFAIITSITVLIPDNLYPFVYVRSILNLLLILYLPGNLLIKILFPKEDQTKNNNQNVEKIERLILSVGLSIVLSYIVGLIINNLPWGIQTISVSLAMLILILFLTPIELIRQKKLASLVPSS